MIPSAPKTKKKMSRSKQPLFHELRKRGFLFLGAIVWDQSKRDTIIFHRAIPGRAKGALNRQLTLSEFFTPID